MSASSTRWEGYSKGSLEEINQRDVIPSVVPIFLGVFC